EVVRLKGGGLRKLLIVSGINFDLKSGEEQQLVLNGFQSFLNTLDFSIQFFIHSRKVNITSYLEKMQERKREEPNELLQIQIEEYIEFVRSFVEQNPIITKSFFVVVPYDPVVIVEKTKKGILGLLKQQPKTVTQQSGTEAKNVEQLNYRVDKVVSGLEQIGLIASLLGDEELIELFYNLYNPELIEKKGVEIPKVK
ncbi:unnamed protein product, partial [marine sediment metagenome]